MVEVAKALSMESKILIFDEPTATLAEKETEALFRIIRVLKERKIGIIYISHRLEEIRKIGDRVTVLRDGHYIGTLKIEEASINDLIRMMVGRDIKDQFPRNYREPGEVALELRGISRQGVLHDIHLKIHRGEIVGLAGLVGSGRTELARVIFGVDAPDAGEIRIVWESCDHRLAHESHRPRPRFSDGGPKGTGALSEPHRSRRISPLPPSSSSFRMG